MKCCIQNCYNVGRVNKINEANGEKITYHLIPKDPKQRETWLRSLAIPNFMPTHRAVICSNHFREEDFYVTKQGTRRLKPGVVPFIKDDPNGSAVLRVCKLCLVLDCKMFQLNNRGLDKMYQDIMGIPPRTDSQNRLPMGICYECTARLQSAASFRAKALFSDALLENHLKSNADLKIIDIQNIHRQHTNLKSTITVQEVFRFNSNNIEEHTPNTFIKAEVIGMPNNEEYDGDVQNLTTIKDERKNPIVMNKNLSSDVKTEDELMTEIEILEHDITFDDDFGDGINDGDETVTENVYIKDGATEIEDTLKNEEITEKNHDDMDISKIMETNDDELMNLAKNLSSDDDDDEDIEIHLKDKTVRCVKIKPKEKKSKQPKIREEPIIWVKARGRNRNLTSKTPYVKPCTPIDENIFSIKTLNHDDLRREILARKDSSRYINAPFKCEVCYRGFPTKDKRERHVLKHSEKSGPIKCNICHVRMKKTRDLRAHTKRQHTMEFICKLCPMVTRIRNVALGHMKYHAGSKYECPQCFLQFEKQTTLLNHLRLKHMSSCVCDLCGYTFVSKNGVDVHKRMKHKLFDVNTEFKGPHCDVCDVKFLTDKAYNRHLRLSSKHITEDDPNRMSNDPSIKQRRLGSSSYYRTVRRPVIHRKDESAPVNNGPVICEQCGVELENLRAYAAHFRFSHPGVNRTQFTQSTTPYMCEHCGKFFLNTTTLACHMWVHTGQKLFQCDHCNKAFSMKANLAGHMRQHEPVRQMYDCRVCGKHFTFSYNLTRHMFLHTGLRPFKCEACEKTFRTSGELRAHVDHVHLKKPRPKRVRRKANKVDMTSLEY